MELWSTTSGSVPLGPSVRPSNIDIPRLTFAGHIVDLAYELGIHRTYDSIRDLGRPSIDEVMRIRLWLTVTIQDF